jgi:hypothetical protein
MVARVELLRNPGRGLECGEGDPGFRKGSIRATLALSLGLPLATCVYGKQDPPLQPAEGIPGAGGVWPMVPRIIIASCRAVNSRGAK